MGRTPARNRQTRGESTPSNRAGRRELADLGDFVGKGLPRAAAAERRLRRCRELRSLKEVISQNDAQTRQQIAFWDAGSPAYRWIDMINARVLAGTPTTAYVHRVYTYVALAMYDATVATWESKSHYNRPRPSELDGHIPDGGAGPSKPLVSV